MASDTSLNQKLVPEEVQKYIKMKITIEDDGVGISKKN